MDMNLRALLHKFPEFCIVAYWDTATLSASDIYVLSLTMRVKLTPHVFNMKAVCPIVKMPFRRYLHQLKREEGSCKCPHFVDLVPKPITRRDRWNQLTMR